MAAQKAREEEQKRKEQESEHVEGGEEVYIPPKPARVQQVIRTSQIAAALNQSEQRSSVEVKPEVKKSAETVLEQPRVMRP